MTAVECHWCGGARAPWRHRLARRAAEALAKVRFWLVEHTNCCDYCGGKGHR